MFSESVKGGNKLIYDRIKNICKEKGLSVNYVEKKAGLSNGIISKWNSCSPTVENVQAVAKVLKCTVDDLLHDKSEAAVEKIS